MLNIASIKANDTFQFTLTISVDGTLLVGAVNNLASQVRTEDDTLLTDFTITELGNGVYALVADDTNFPEGKVYMDIQYTDENTNTVTSSDTYSITVTKDVTRDV